MQFAAKEPGEEVTNESSLKNLEQRHSQVSTFIKSYFLSLIVLTFGYSIVSSHHAKVSATEVYNAGPRDTIFNLGNGESFVANITNLEVPDMSLVETNQESYMLVKELVNKIASERNFLQLGQVFKRYFQNPVESVHLCTDIGLVCGSYEESVAFNVLFMRLIMENLLEIDASGNSPGPVLVLNTPINRFTEDHLTYINNYVLNNGYAILASDQQTVEMLCASTACALNNQTIVTSVGRVTEDFWHEYTHVLSSGMNQKYLGMSNELPPVLFENYLRKIMDIELAVSPYQDPKITQAMSLEITQDEVVRLANIITDPQENIYAFLEGILRSDENGTILRASKDYINQNYGETLLNITSDYPIIQLAIPNIIETTRTYNEGIPQGLKIDINYIMGAFIEGYCNQYGIQAGSLDDLMLQFEQ